MLSEPAEKQTAKKSDAMIMAEAIRLVGEGVAVAFPVNGRSMLPFIVGGRDEVVLVKPERVKVGDIVLGSFMQNFESEGTERNILVIVNPDLYIKE